MEYLLLLVPIAFTLGILVTEYKYYKPKDKWQKEALVGVIHRATKQIEKAMGLMQKRQYKNARTLLKEINRDLLDLRSK